MCRCLCNLDHTIKSTMFLCLMDHCNGLWGQLNPPVETLQLLPLTSIQQILYILYDNHSEVYQQE